MSFIIKLLYNFIKYYWYYK